MTIRVVVADDQALVRTALASLIGLENDIDVAGQAGTGAEVLQIVRETFPDVVLMDVQMPAGARNDGTPGPSDGVEAAREVITLCPTTRVIVVTTFGRPGYLTRTMQAGAVGFITKDAPPAQLIEAIRRVHAGLRVVDPELAASSLTIGPSPLTDQETAVLRATAQGGSTAVIAERVFLSEGTVRNYLSSAIGKLGAANRAEAIRNATDNGWL